LEKLVVGGLVWISILMPVPLLIVAWSRKNRRPIELALLTLSALLLLVATVRSLKLALLGSDYSNRLFGTIDVNFLLTLILGIRLSINRMAFAATTAFVLMFAWALMAAINAAV
jgi:hypothetical protein